MHSTRSNRHKRRSSRSDNNLSRVRKQHVDNHKRSRVSRSKSSTRSTKKEPYKCYFCKKCFQILDHLKKHLKDNSECLAHHPFKCRNCEYVGYKNEDLRNHKNKKPACAYFYSHEHVLTGLLPLENKMIKIPSERISYSSNTAVDDVNFDMDGNSLFDCGDNEVHMMDFARTTNSMLKSGFPSSPNTRMAIKTTSYSMKKKNIDGTNIDVVLNISDFTEGQRNALLQSSGLNNSTNVVAKQLVLEDFYNKSKTIARMSDYELPSKLIFDSNSHNLLCHGITSLEKEGQKLPSIHQRSNYENVEEDVRYEELNDEYGVIDETCADDGISIADSIGDSGTVMNLDSNSFSQGTVTEQEANDTTTFPIDVNCDPTAQTQLQSDEHTLQNNTNLGINENRTSGVDVRQLQRQIKLKYDTLTLNDLELMSIDLFHILRASNAPMSLFDRIVLWTKNHARTFQKRNLTKKILSRKSLLTRMNNKLNYDKLYCHPKVTPVRLSSGRTTSVVTFSAKDLILKVINDKSLFRAENILLNVNDPCSLPQLSNTISEANTGSWHKEAVEKECTNPKDVLMPWTFFIDGLKVDKFGKLTVEAVIGSCLWYKKSVRNRSSAWSVLGFVQDQSLFRDYTSYVSSEKAQDYHDMISHIFSEFKAIRDNGGLAVTLDFGSNRKHDVCVKPVIQFIIGDCKGNDLLCGRKGGHSVMMKGLCRDCDISPQRGDETFRNMDGLGCHFLTKDDIVGKSDDELDLMSMLPIKNAFFQISFGGCARNIFGATPVEILHAVQLGLCEYIAEALDTIFTSSALEIISKTLVGIIAESKRQSERNLPNLGPFRMGLMSVKSLKAKERFARVYCVYLCLSNSYCVKALCSKKRKRQKNQPHSEVPYVTRDYLRGFRQVIEETLIFHQWLKEDSYPRSDFDSGQNGEDCRAMTRLKNFAENFKTFVVRSGNGLKTPKFHQVTLHIVDYIERFGVPGNWDGSRPEFFGKEIVKDHAKLTNKQKETLNFDISRRICETDVIDEVSKIFYQKHSRWPSQYCNDVDIMNKDVDGNGVEDDEYVGNPNVVYKSAVRFYISAQLLYNTEGPGDIQHQRDVFNVHLDWGTKEKIPMLNYPEELQKRLFSRLFIGSPNIGGKVALENGVRINIPCYTQVKVGNTIYRAHPCYSRKGCWYDWAYFEWHGYSKPIVGKILMIVDLTNTPITYSADINPDGNILDEDVAVHKHLTNDVWVIVHAALGPLADAEKLDDDHFDSAIGHWVELCPETDLWTIPLSALVGPCCVIANRNYLLVEENVDKNVVSDDSITAFVVEPMSKWGKLFLPETN